MKKKIIAAVVSLSLVFSMVIGGTLAWLIDKTDSVKNTFTYGDINIDLEEATGPDYEMVPGNTIAKDPVVTVEAESETCWLFVEIVEGGVVTIGGTTYTFDEFLTYAVADGWTLLEQKPENEADNTNETYVYYRSVSTSGVDQEFEVLSDNTVTVKDTVTKEMMNAIDGIDVDGKTDTDSAKGELDARPTLTFTAYAVQSANITDVNANNTAVDEAWAIAKPASIN